MSGETHGIYKGQPCTYKGETKIIKDWYFISTPIHNSDEIIIMFTDETQSTNGWTDITILT